MLQSNYIPWKGYFDLMRWQTCSWSTTRFQYTKNDWRNRNLLDGPNGTTWLTIPVQTAGRRSNVSMRRRSPMAGGREHWMTVVQCLGKRPFFSDYRIEWEQWFRGQPI